jgi:hypothetical protein
MGKFTLIHKGQFVVTRSGRLSSEHDFLEISLKDAEKLAEKLGSLQVIEDYGYETQTVVFSHGLGLSETVKSDLKKFVEENLEDLKGLLAEDNAFEDPGVDLTVAVNDAGDSWSFQTGDNSFSGGAYLNPHWAVVTIGRDSTAEEILSDIIQQLEELLES